MSYSDIFTSYKAVLLPYEDIPIEEDFKETSVPLLETDMPFLETNFRASYPDIAPPEEIILKLLKTVLSNNLKSTEPLKGSKSFEEAFLKALKIDPSIAKYKDFLVKTAKRESNFNSSIQNTTGAPYYGYFLMGASEIKLTTGLSVEEFRADPVKLILGAVLLYKLNLKTLKRIGAYDLCKQKGYSEDAMMAGAWMGGPGGVKTYITGAGDPSDYHWYKKAGLKGGSSVGKIMNDWRKNE